jgi:hypothetical protein
MGQLPLQQVGQHHHEDVAPSAGFGLHKGGADFQMTAFKGAKGAFHLGQVLVTLMHGRGAGGFPRHIALDYITALQLGFFRPGFRINFQGQGAFVECYFSPLANFKQLGMVRQSVSGDLRIGPGVFIKITLFI